MPVTWVLKTSLLLYLPVCHRQFLAMAVFARFCRRILILFSSQMDFHPQLVYVGHVVRNLMLYCIPSAMRKKLSDLWQKSKENVNVLQSGREETKDCCMWLKLSCCHFLTVKRTGFTFYICIYNRIQVCYDFDAGNGWDPRWVREVNSQPELLYKWLPQSWGPGMHLQLDDGFQFEHRLNLASGFCIKEL